MCFTRMLTLLTFPDFDDERSRPLFTMDRGELKVITDDGYYEYDSYGKRKAAVLKDMDKISSDWKLEDAVECINFLLTDAYKLTDDAGYAGLLSYALTLLLRDILPADQIPAFLIEKPQSQTGATKFARVINYSLNFDPMVGDMPYSNEEIDKRLVSIALSSKNSILFDNVSFINSSALCCVFNFIDILG